VIVTIATDIAGAYWYVFKDDEAVAVLEWFSPHGALMNSAITMLTLVSVHS